MPTNKRQHYVPQLYLKYFSNDKKTITVFSIKEEKIVTHKAPINRQCYEDYMYSDNLEYEEGIKEIEDYAKIIFEKIIKFKKIPERESEDYSTLLLYILFQSSRTLFAADQLNDSYEKMTKSVLRDHIVLNKIKNLNVDDLKKIKIKQPNAAILSAQYTTRSIPLVLDLKCKLLLNNTKTEFITSDNPVVLYNKYYREKEPSYIGFACKGLSIIIPITPRECLIYYDQKMYKVGGQKLNSNVNLKNDREVDELNKLQCINSNQTIYTLKMKNDYLMKLLKSVKKYRFKEKSIVRETDFKKNNDGKLSRDIINSRPAIKYDINASFFKINKKIPEKYLKQFMWRDLFLLKIHSEFREKMNKGELILTDWNDFYDSKI